MKIYPLIHVRLYELEEGGRRVHWIVHAYQVGDTVALGLGHRISVN